MLRDDSTSSRIEILRFPLIVGVVFIHNYFTTVSLANGSFGVAQNSAWVDFVRFFISQGIARVAVPLFFLISGYLFFLGGWSQDKYIGKLEKRVHTLLIPYVFWNLAALLYHLGGEEIPQAKAYVTGLYMQDLHSFSLFHNINAWFGITAGYPVSMHFWFIRDLMALILLAPVIHFLLARKSALPFLIILFGIWLFLPGNEFWQNTTDALFYFCLGSYLSQAEKNVVYLDKFGSWISTIFLGLLTLNSFFPDSPFSLRRVVIIFGVPSVWWLAGLANRNAKWKSWLTGLSAASFFVFAAHEPLLTIFRKLCYKLFSPASGAAILALYFLIPICLVTLLVALHRCLLKIMPSFLGFISGSSYRFHKQRA
jgi:surface polysaccharide O-acyltransferase-like enzyme